MPVNTGMVRFIPVVIGRLRGFDSLSSCQDGWYQLTGTVISLEKVGRDYYYYPYPPFLFCVKTIPKMV